MQGLQLQYLPVAPSPPPLALRRKASNYRTWIKSTTLPMPRTWIKSTSRRSLYVIRGRSALTIPNSGSSCPPCDSGNSSPSGETELDRTTKIYEFVLPKLEDFVTHMVTTCFILLAVWFYLQMGLPLPFVTVGIVKLTYILHYIPTMAGIVTYVLVNCAYVKHLKNKKG
ncbi:uncharacterized protein LOC113754443 [Coffea eugenioides]|uniref:uncharacterized protein LOC113754443 n=1 Tax=Coffea eugenioides TaxID=49369 RepID=UPI000F609591|nr:uncharacterized protein LOC113754443 [Coffea eugenioides]